MGKIVFFLILFQPGYDLPPLPMKENKETKKTGLIEWIGLKLIDFYQNTLSPVQGELCNFEPSCSRFTERAIKNFGLIKGVLLGFDRMQRDHPFTFKYIGKYYNISILPNHKIKAFDPPENYFKNEMDYSPFIPSIR